MEIKCTQCGGDVTVREGDKFLKCPFCGSALFIDRRRVVYHHILTPTVTADQARAALKRWMAGNQTVKGLEREAAGASLRFTFFPVWLFKVRQGGGESVQLLPAAATPIAEYRRLTLPAGDLQFFRPELVAGQEVKAVEVMYDAAQAWLAQTGVKPEDVAESSLVHVPVYEVRYDYKGKPFQGLVDAASGKVIAEVFPRKAEVPYVLATAVTFLVFLLAGTAAPTAGARLALYLILSVPLFFLALLTSSKA